MTRSRLRLGPLLERMYGRQRTPLSRQQHGELEAAWRADLLGDLEDQITDLREELTAAEREQHGRLIAAGVRPGRPTAPPEHRQPTDEEREALQARRARLEAEDAQRLAAEAEQRQQGREERWRAHRAELERRQREVRKAAMAEGVEPPKFPPLSVTAPQWFEQQDGVAYVKSRPLVERNEDGQKVIRSDIDLLTGRRPGPVAPTPEEQFAEAAK